MHSTKLTHGSHVFRQCGHGCGVMFALQLRLVSAAELFRVAHESVKPLSGSQELSYIVSCSAQHLVTQTIIIQSSVRVVVLSCFSRVPRLAGSLSY